MAEVIESMPPRRNSGQYWDELLDGTARVLERGVDYSVDEQAMAARAWQAAKRRGIRVVVRYSREMKHVCIQAVTDDAPRSA